jgi:hypothetical protein
LRIYVPGDETTFHVFEDTTLEALNDALANVQLPFDRIVEVQ